jgi:hypothetical protein
MCATSRKEKPEKGLFLYYNNNWYYMKKIIFILIVLIISSFLLLGCTEENQNNSTEVNKLNDQAQQWSQEVIALGEPTYDTIDIETGYKILPFPGLEYNGFRDNWQAFYAANQDYTFAIYASPEIIENAGTYEEVKQKAINEYNLYSSSLKCEDISTDGWLTQAKAFSCSYVYSDYISYKIVTFYKDSKYIQTNLSVWGTSLQDYEYIFDEFNAKAVSWK